jgi:hypothetical protein
MNEKLEAAKEYALGLWDKVQANPISHGAALVVGLVLGAVLF